jgi:DNA-binding MarR family transcriptional regulator
MPLASATITARPRRALTDPVTSGPGGAAEAAFLSLIKTLGLLKRVMEPHFAQFGISASQWGVLVTLHRCGSGRNESELRLTDLGDRLIVRPASITGVVDRLQRMGLVDRSASPSDHRAKNVTLTESGRQLVSRVLEHHPAQMQRVMQGLSDCEQADLQRLLDKLVSHLEPMSGCTNAHCAQASHP